MDKFIEDSAMSLGTIICIDISNPPFFILEEYKGFEVVINKIRHYYDAIYVAYIKNSQFNPKEVGMITNIKI